jgi:hypothetical protein
MHKIVLNGLTQWLKQSEQAGFDAVKRLVELSGSDFQHGGLR